MLQRNDGPDPSAAGRWGNANALERYGRLECIAESGAHAPPASIAEARIDAAPDAFADALPNACAFADANWSSDGITYADRNGNADTDCVANAVAGHDSVLEPSR